MKTKRLALALFSLLFLSLEASAAFPKALVGCHLKVNEKEVPIFYLDSLSSVRPTVYVDAEPILTFLGRLSELNPGYPDGSDLVLTGPIGCAPMKDRQGRDYVKCLLGSDEGHDFWFSIEHQDQEFTGYFEYESNFGGLSVSHYLRCQ